MTVMGLWTMKLKRLIPTVVALILLALSGAIPANAATNCRQVARDVQSKGLVASTTDSTGNKTIQVFTDAIAAYPECESELNNLWEWNITRDPNSPFPFAKSGDPKSYPLGPVSWWWDVIYNKLFNGSILLMILFGWELFLMPIPLVFIMIAFPISLVTEIIKRKRTKG